MKLARVMLAAALIAGSGLGASAQDFDGSKFYDGKTIKWIVGGGPGGGFDKYARLIGPKVEAATGATVVVEYRPEGGGMTAISQVAASSASGMTIMMINGVPAALGQITEAPAIRFKLQDLTVLGRVAAEPWVLLVSKDSGYKTLQDLIDASRSGKTLSFSGLGRTDGLTDTAAVACEALSLNCKLVIGYKGSHDSALAAIRGDVTGFAVSDRSAKDFSSDGTLVPLAVIGRSRSTLLPDVPTIFEAVDVPADKEFWIDFRGRIVEIGRALITASDTPDDQVAYLRKMFDGILTNPDFIKEAEGLGLPISYASGADVQATIKEVFDGLPEDRLKAVRNVLLTKYF